ncbi:MAG: D-aminoacyl-tRNA deacylase [Bacteroidota bacterium]|nr:D-aminoacyl-tRNA deacylase [Bacteroidota bacterium]
MKAVVQRVSSGSVSIPSENYYSEIKDGLVILLGIKIGDTEKDAVFVADKCSNLRIFGDSEDKMNLSVKDIEGEVLIVSQFTLYGETAKGNRPNFTLAARPEEAVPLYELFIRRMKENIGSQKIKTGLFGAMMQVSIVNEGPVTVIVEK